MFDKQKILLVDDDDNDLELFQRAVATLDLPVTVVAAHDGIEALEFLRRQTAESLPKLIVVDYKMPRMDGVHLLIELQQDQRLNKIPAVVLTSSKDHQDIARTYAAGASAYILKPVNFSEFRSNIEVLIKFWLQLNQTED